MLGFGVIFICYELVNDLMAKASTGLKVFRDKEKNNLPISRAIIKKSSIKFCGEKNEIIPKDKRASKKCG